MNLPPNNSSLYPERTWERTREQEQFQVFLARVLTVDYERKVCTIEDLRSGMTYREVSVFPANSSSFESTDVQMPEESTTCLAVPIAYSGGFSQIAIVSYVLRDANKAQDAIALRPMDKTPVYNERKRGTYRKAYPGQKTVSVAAGYSEKIEAGWDRSAGDFSRDKLDPYRRTWTQVTSRRISYTDAGLTLSGPVNRPEAEGIPSRTLPDGSKEYVVYLDPSAQLKDRYLDGKQDVVAFTERTERVQEFALDYPLPPEVLEHGMLEELLGINRDPWERTEVVAGKVATDDQSYTIDQNWDHPYGGRKVASTVGPTVNEGQTPRRHAFIIERTEGTLVGYNHFDKDTYGKVLKPVVFPYTREGRFASGTEVGHLAVKDSPDHVEARLAASALAVRFPYEYNTTRWDVTKEGFISLEVGSTLPAENIAEHWQSNGYEHPHGAGRSLEAHFVGSIKTVVGKNRDEEEAIDLQALGQVCLRIGADDGTLPDAGRQVLTQIRGDGDKVETRQAQYWKKPKLVPGDAGSLGVKTGAENISVRGALDGGLVMRFGARNPKSQRRHLANGYTDGQGHNPWNDPARKSSVNGGVVCADSRTDGRVTYGAGDSVYQFHDLTQSGKPVQNRGNGFAPFVTSGVFGWAGNPVTSTYQPNSPVDSHGLSADLHFVRDVLLRAGKNPDSWQSVLVDTDGGVVMAVGKDKQGRSMTATFDGGLELVIGAKNSGTGADSMCGKGIRIEINGDVDMVVKGNKHELVTGEYILECTSYRKIVKTDSVSTAQNQYTVAMNRSLNEAPTIDNNNLLYHTDESGNEVE